MYSFEFFLVWCVYAACVRYGVGVVDVVVIIVITIATLHPLYFMHEIHGNYWLKHLNLDRQTDRQTHTISLSLSMCHILGLFHMPFFIISPFSFVKSIQ